MNFPSILFFYKINSYYSYLRLGFLNDDYFKLHNILFTNLYIRIYRYKLTKIQQKNTRMNIKEKYQKIDRDLFSDKIKKKTRRFVKRKTNMEVADINKRNFSYSLCSFYSFNENKTVLDNKREYNKQRSRKKKGYVYINKFKDCGNQYNFDPFYPGSTYKLSEYNFYRTKKTKKKNIILPKPKLDLSVFDSRLGDANFKYFNNYLFNLLLDVYNNKETNKKEFLSILKNNNSFFLNFLRFLKRRISYIRVIILNFKKVLRNYIYKLNLFNQSLSLDKDSLFLVLSYLKSKNSFFFKLYLKLISNYNIAFSRLEKANILFSTYVEVYNSLFSSLKKKHASLVNKKKKKSNSKDYFKRLAKVEKFHHTITNLHARAMRFFKIKDMHQWEKKKSKSNIYVTMNKYLTLYRSLFKYYFLKDHFNNNAIIYIKSTATNVYLYFIYGNKLLFKKSCGELPDIKKKERRFWRNVYPLIEAFLPFLVQMKAKYKFPFVSLYLNGTSSLCSPLLSKMRKYNKKFRRVVYFLFNEMDFFSDKTLELKEKFENRYVLYPVYRLKFYSIIDGFNRLSKIFFAINKVKDITSWPYNGCKKKKKKMLDSLSPFKQKRHLLRQLNCLQFFKSRFGIGVTIAKSLCYFSGLHPNLRMHLFLDNYFNSFFSHFYILKKIKYFFLTNKNNLDHFLHKEMISCINVLKTIRCLKGKRHSTFLPVRGQRNRTNARTRKIIYLGIDKKNKKKKTSVKNNIVKNTNNKTS